MPYKSLGPSGSPRFRLWLNDAWPIIRRGLWGAATAFLTIAAASLFGVTVEHWPILGFLAGPVGSAIEAAIRFTTDQSKR